MISGTRSRLHRGPVGQSRGMSVVEALTNTTVGYVLAVLTQLAVFPFFGLAVSVSAHLTIGVAFVVVSLARSYLLRRLFERLRRPQQPVLRTSEAD